MTERTYTINELKQLIKESATEFKAKLGDGVDKGNKEINQKSYKDSEKKMKDFNGDIKEKPQTVVNDKIDGNKTTLDYTLDGNPGDDYREKIKAQAEGYTSTLEKNNKIEKSGEFSDKTYKMLKKAGETMQKNVEDMKKSGLTGRMAPKDTFKKDNMYKESTNIKVLTFKNTTFLNENQMISKIPDHYKVEGNRFKVKDAGQNEFIVEWCDNEANILSYENKQKLNESINKFKKLCGYKLEDQVKISNTQNRLHESNEFVNILNKTRELINK